MGMSPLTIFGASTELWLRSDLGIVTVSGKVSQWRDQSGKGRHFDQSTAADRPTYNALDANWGYPSLTFDGAGDRLNSAVTAPWAFLKDGTGSVMICVMRADSTGAATYAVVLGANAAGATHRFQLAVEPSLERCGIGITNGTTNVLTVSIDFAAFTADANHYAVAAYENGRAGNEYLVQVDSDTPTTGNDSGATPSADAPDAFRIGAQSGSVGQFKGQILEVIAASVYPAATQRTQLNTYMAARYGL